MFNGRQSACLFKYLYKIINIKFMFIICCTMTLLFWMQLQCFNAQDKNIAFKKSNIEKTHNIDDPIDVTSEVNKKARKNTKHLKYVLLWTNKIYPLHQYGKGQTGLFKTNCPATECYITANRKFFGGVLTKFDAIIFSGGQYLMSGNLPVDRSPHQKYIFITLETPYYRPPCDLMLEGFFNWTATYRLDSDIPHPYIIIRDINGNIVGPKREMVWKTDMAVLNNENEVNDTTRNKTKAVAWFVSKCRSKSKRESIVAGLQIALQKFGHKIDIFGRCGPFQCPKLNDTCNVILHDYFFYLAMENSFDEDYVSEKVLHALLNNVVPIVYGGANYSRFLPPGSYIDARKQSSEQLAATINTLIHCPKQYKQYFSWKKLYIFESAVHNECVICEALSNKTRFQEQTIHKPTCIYKQKNQNQNQQPIYVPIVGKNASSLREGSGRNPPR